MSAKHGTENNVKECFSLKIRSLLLASCAVLQQLIMKQMNSNPNYEPQDNFFYIKGGHTL
jgi:hypothetical protein